MKIKSIVLFIIVLFLYNSCKDEVLLDSKYNSKILVVDGFITNGPGPYTINLSYTAPVSLPEYLKCTGSVVTIYNDNGYSEVLTEEEPGVYMTSGIGIQGIVGDKYRISVHTQEGKDYETEFQELKEPVGIDSIYADIEYITIPDFALPIPGYQFYVNTKSSDEFENYFLWTMSESYEYDVDWEFGYIETRFGDRIYNYPRFDTLSTCWKTENVKYIYTGSMSDLSIPQIDKQPIVFVGTDTKRITKRYSLLLKQYTIDEKAYDYWKEIEAQLSDENLLSTSQPFNVKSNLYNINDKDELVIGYFTVASIDEKRTFVNKPDVDFYYPKTSIITDPTAISEFRRLHSPPYYYVEIGDQEYALLAYESCLDCRNEGGELVKPDFWLDQ